MAIFSTENPWTFSVGLLGNIISLVVFLAPVPTFYRVCKKKTTEGFQSIPYVVALFSAMLWLYYASLETNIFLLVTINSVGCVIETIYIALYLAYAPKQVKMTTLRLLILLNFGGFCSIILISRFLLKRQTQVQVMGWICDALAVSFFAAPLSVMRMVIRTKSVEFMPPLLSFFLLLSAITWLLYGILLKDFYVTLPNIFGVLFGVAQMILYAIYQKPAKAIAEEKTEIPAASAGKQDMPDIESGGGPHEDSGGNKDSKDGGEQEECTEVKP